MRGWLGPSLDVTVAMVPVLREVHKTKKLVPRLQEDVESMRPPPPLDARPGAGTGAGVGAGAETELSSNNLALLGVLVAVWYVGNFVYFAESKELGAAWAGAYTRPLLSST